MLSRTNRLKRRTLLLSAPLISTLSFSTISSLFSSASADAEATSAISGLDYSYQIYLQRLKSLGSVPTYQIADNAAAKASIEIIKLFGGSPQRIDPTETWIDGPYGKLRLVVYKPQGDGPFPVTMYLHGGG